jgi:hypothetical protein
MHGCGASELERTHHGRERRVSATQRHVTQESLHESPGQMDYRALRATPARAFQTGDVVNDEEASSEVTLAERSSVEDDEQHRRADGRARIARRKGFRRDLEAEVKQAAESSWKRVGGERLR